MYDTWEYANTRLNGTIISLITGAPIFVHSVGPRFMVHYNLLNEEFDKARACKISEVNLEPVALGFCNTPKGAVYLSRQPKRDDWRQGLRDNTITSNPARGKVPLKCIDEAIKGVKVDVNKALTYSAESGRMVAFHRYWAVERGKLFHKWYMVGKISEDGVVFLEKYQYLESRYAEDVKYG